MHNFVVNTSINEMTGEGGGFCGVPVKRIVQWYLWSQRIFHLGAVSDCKTQMGRDAFLLYTVGTGKGEVWKEVLNLRYLSGRL